MNKFFSIDDIVIIDRSKIEFVSNRIYLINVKRNFVFRRVARSIVTGKIEVYSLKQADDEKNYTPILSIDNIDDIDILGIPVYKMSKLKGV